VTDALDALRPRFAEWRLLCISHLPWQTTLYQRPHQIMRRLATVLPVAYVAPISTRQFFAFEERRRLGISITGRQGDLAWMHPGWAPWSHKHRWALHATTARLARRGGQCLRSLAPTRPRTIAWLQFPSFASALDHTRHERLVVDVMDPFGQFSHRFPQAAGEADVWLGKADLLTTGGHAMRELLPVALRERAVPLPSGVDVEHFAQALTLRAAHAPCGQRVAGYAGNLDERLDWDLLRAAALGEPDWRFELVGPGASPEAWERPQNVVLTGPCPYAELPRRLAGWDAGLVPFKRGDLGDALSPTKVPEYLAAGLSVIATALPDICRTWGDVCMLGDTTAEWRGALAACPPGATSMNTKLSARLLGASWDALALEFAERLAAIVEQ